MNYHIAVLPGDGIGPEVMNSAIQVLKAIEKKFNQKFRFTEASIGGQAFDAYQTHFPESTKVTCREADAILLGSVGGPSSERHLPKWKQCEANSLLALRKEFGFYGNIRPSRVYPALQNLCPLKDCLISGDIDMVIIRELLGDLYFGRHETVSKNGGLEAIDEAVYSEEQIRKVARLAFKVAGTRKKKVCSVDKANVLDTSRLWREIVNDEARSHPDISVSHMFVDNAAMQLIQNPGDFDVLLCPNMFGDILSDLASVLPGSLGMLPSASFSASGKGLYEPAGGSAPDIAGKNIANPVAQILSAALMLRHSFGLEKEATKIESGVEHCLSRNILTRDLSRDETWYSTSAFTDTLTNYILNS